MLVWAAKRKVSIKSEIIDASLTKGTYSMIYLVALGGSQHSGWSIWLIPLLNSASSYPHPLPGHGSWQANCGLWRRCREGCGASKWLNFWPLSRPVHLCCETTPLLPHLSNPDHYPAEKNGHGKLAYHNLIYWYNGSPFAIPLGLKQNDITCHSCTSLQLNYPNAFFPSLSEYKENSKVTWQKSYKFNFPNQSPLCAVLWFIFLQVSFSQAWKHYSNLKWMNYSVNNGSHWKHLSDFHKTVMVVGCF